jgi:hypothetical protein
MSNDYMLMLSSVLTALQRQKAFLRSEEERQAWHYGRKQWTNAYLNHFYEELVDKGLSKLTRKEVSIIFHYGTDFFRVFGNNIKIAIRRKLKFA